MGHVINVHSAEEVVFSTEVKECALMRSAAE